MVSIRLAVVAKDSKGRDDENPDEEVEGGEPEREKKIKNRKKTQLSRSFEIN